ncbi:hypothetical protein HDU98_002464 [Podochytrium sp. JEL0797]|nr:hypothetical protein HDU98_002464 [Podochytrium sp. JEL0797]
MFARLTALARRTALPTLLPTRAALFSRPNSSSSLFNAALSEAEAAANTSSSTGLPLVADSLRVKGAAFRQSAKKTNLVAKVCRGLELQHAIDQMRFSPKRPAMKVAQVLRQAQRNALAQTKDDNSKWVVSQCFVGKSSYLKRMKLHARGRFGIMHHPSCHVTVIVKRVSKDVDVEFEKLVHIFKRHKLYAPFREAKPRFLNPVWSRKSYKYVTSQKWLSPKQ